MTLRIARHGSYLAAVFQQFECDVVRPGAPVSYFLGNNVRPVSLEIRQAAPVAMF